MRRTFGVAAAGFLFVTTTALASDAFIEDCEEFKAANGVGGDCACMAEAAEAAGVADEIMATETLEDIESLSDAAKAVIDDCG